MSSQESLSPKEYYILVVDDDPNLLSLLRTCLSLEQYRLFMAADATEAEEVLAEKEIDLILCDHMMPEKSGIAFLSELKDSRPELVRILVTVDTSPGSLIKAINEGRIYRYVKKPFTVEEIRSAVKQGLDQCDLIRENKRLLALTRDQNERLWRLTDELEERAEEQARALRSADSELGRAGEIISQIEAERSKLSVLAGLDFGLPLTLLREYIELIRREPGGLPAGRLVELSRILLGEIESLEKTAKGISRSGDAGRDDARHAFDLTELIRLAVRDLEPLADSQGLEFRVEAPAPLIVRAERGRIRNVLVYLFFEALRTAPTGGCLLLSAEKREGDALVRLEAEGEADPGAEGAPPFFRRYDGLLKNPETAHRVVQAVLDLYDGVLEGVPEARRSVALRLPLREV